MDSAVIQESATFDKVLFGRSLSRILSPPKPVVVSPLKTNTAISPESEAPEIKPSSSEVTNSRPSSKIGPSRFSTLMIAFKPWRWRRRQRKNHKTSEATKGSSPSLTNDSLSHPVLFLILFFHF